jgi:hypothetical protein
MNGGYYRRFIKNFAAIAAPLNELLKDNQPWDWIPQVMHAFKTLKEALTSAPLVVHAPDPGYQ